MEIAIFFFLRLAVKARVNFDNRRSSISFQVDLVMNMILKFEEIYAI